MRLKSALPVFALITAGGAMVVATVAGFRPPVQIDEHHPPIDGSGPFDDTSIERQIPLGPNLGGASEGEEPREEDRWLLDQERPARLDTSSFTYGYAITPDNPWGGEQTYGTVDKYGVQNTVLEVHDDRDIDFAHIGSVNATREAFLTANGKQVPEGDTWFIDIFLATTLVASSASSCAHPSATISVLTVPSECWTLTRSPKCGELSHQVRIRRFLSAPWKAIHSPTVKVA